MPEKRRRLTKAARAGAILMAREHEAAARRLRKEAREGATEDWRATYLNEMHRESAIVRMLKKRDRARRVK